MFNTPILLLIFNRPLHTQQVVDRIRAIKPTELFVGADGPRSTHPEDIIRCKETRKIVMQAIDWPCEVSTLFRDANLGCGRAPAEAISWFFDHVEKGIILEDDCLPSLSFFSFCSLMLSRYRNDPNIISICGYNFAGTWHADTCDYFFSDGGNWGWATWRRGWELYDYYLMSWPTLPDDQRKLVEDYYPNFNDIYKQLTKDQTDVWDLQWHYARLIYRGLSITPSKNLIQNIGFGTLATHTFEKNNLLGNLPKYEIDVSDSIKPMFPAQIDLQYRKKIFELSSQPVRKKNILNILKRWIKNILDL